MLTPIVSQIALQLVRPQQRVSGIRGEATEGSAEHRRLGIAQLLRPPQEAARGAQAHRSASANSSMTPDVGEFPRRASRVLGLRLAHLREEESAAQGEELGLACS